MNIQIVLSRTLPTLQHMLERNFSDILPVLFKAADIRPTRHERAYPSCHNLILVYFSHRNCTGMGSGLWFGNHINPTAKGTTEWELMRNSTSPQQVQNGGWCYINDRFLEEQNFAIIQAVALYSRAKLVAVKELV